MSCFHSRPESCLYVLASRAQVVLELRPIYFTAKERQAGRKFLVLWTWAIKITMNPLFFVPYWRWHIWNITCELWMRKGRRDFEGLPVWNFHQQLKWMIFHIFHFSLSILRWNITKSRNDQLTGWNSVHAWIFFLRFKLRTKLQGSYCYPTVLPYEQLALNLCLSLQAYGAAHSP